MQFDGQCYLLPLKLINRFFNGEDPLCWSTLKSITNIFKLCGCETLILVVEKIFILAQSFILSVLLA